MRSSFSFDRALTWPVRAPHFGSFPWLYGAAYAVIYLLLFIIVGVAGWQDLSDWFLDLQFLDDDRYASPDELLGALFGGLAGLLPLLGFAILAGWVIWAMFEAASQRRYIFGQGFSLGFGADELRLMIVSLMWMAMTGILFLIPLVLMFSGFAVMIEAEINDRMNDAVGLRVAGFLLSSLGSGLIFFFVYVFLATRFAPCFGLTIKEKSIRFFDAWNVSRRRFWPILGAYIILAFIAGLVSQIVSTLAQFTMTPLFMALPVEGDVDPEEFLSLLASPAILLPLGLIYLLMLFVQGLTQHVIGAPAALAARHDPRNDLGEPHELDVFS